MIAMQTPDAHLFEDEFLDELDGWRREPAKAWDCDPEALLFGDSPDMDLDEEDDTGDWQVLVLDRFGDRTVWPGLDTRHDPFAERAALLAEQEAWELELVKRWL